MGTTLVDVKHSNQLLWPPPLTITPQIVEGKILEGTSRKLRLSPDGNTDDIPDRDIRPGTLIETFDIYPSLIRFLKLIGYKENESLFTFPYDWRKDLSGSAEELGMKIQTWKSKFEKNTKFSIIAHSSGGLVAARYLSQQGSIKPIRVLITLGTPFKGSPKIFKLMMEGDKSIEGFDVASDSDDLKQVIRSFPSVYELLPVYPFIQYKNEYQGVFDIPKYSWPRSWQNNRVQMNLTNNYLEKAKNFHRAILEQFTDVVEINIITSTLSTITGFTAVNDNLDKFVEKSSLQGDGTVPSDSAARPKAYEVLYITDKTSHHEMPKSKEVQTLIGYLMWLFSSD